MQFKTKLGLVDIPNDEVLTAARDIARDGAARIPALMDRVQQLEDLLRSARCIAQRKGEGTAWERFDASIAQLGIGSITARVYTVLPDDPAKAGAGDRCTVRLREQGKAYPRTCEECGLGPCRYGPQKINAG